MTAMEVFSGVPGILRPFKEFIGKSGIQKGDQILYFGVPGTCTPFIELLSFAVRSLEPDQVFVPYTDESRAKRIAFIEDVGMQARMSPVVLKPKAIVILGGLSMPGVPVQPEQVQAAIRKHPGAVVIGVCFMHMFAKAGWTKTLSFDLLIDANIDPVEVTGK